MELYKKIPFTFEGNDYEIRLMFDDRVINIVTFRNNYPHNGFRYHVKIPKNVDTKKLLKIEPFPHFIEMAKEDVIKKRWDRIMEKIY